MIIGLTDNFNQKITRIGKIYKGSPKREKNGAKIYGQDLDHFRFETNDETIAQAFENRYGKTPREIEILLPYETPQEVFPNWKEEWNATEMLHRCDGQTTNRIRKANGHIITTPQKCPGNCKPVGYLNFIIPALNRLGLISLTTHSIWDILEIQAQLNFIYGLRRSLKFVPMALRRIEKSIAISVNGNRRKVKKYLIALETIGGQWAALQLQAMQSRGLLPPANNLEEEVPLTPEEEKEFQVFLNRDEEEGTIIDCPSTAEENKFHSASTEVWEHWKFIKESLLEAGFKETQITNMIAIKLKRSAEPESLNDDELNSIINEVKSKTRKLERKTR